MEYKITENAIGHGGSAGMDETGNVFQDRVFLVEGFTGVNVPARPILVMDASVGGVSIPARNAEHPAYNWRHLVVLSKNVEILGNEEYVVTCRYGVPTAVTFEPGLDPASAIISVSATLVESETSFDIDDNEIFTSHFDDESGNPKKVRGSVSDHAVTVVVRYDRPELGSPGGKALTHAGRLNSDNLIFGVDGPRTWLCSEISGTSSDGGVTYNSAYEFIRSPKVKRVGGDNVVQPWDVEIVEINPDTGTFVEGAESGRGKKIIEVKGEAAFNALSLPFAPVA